MLYFERVNSFDSILSNLSRHISTSHQEIEFFLSLLEKRDVEKKDFLLREGRTCKYFSFVVKGAFRAFHVNQEAKETTIMFAIADWWITDMYCFLNNKPAMVNIQAIEDSSVLQI